jgi:DNA adenine methylase
MLIKPLIVSSILVLLNFIKMNYTQSAHIKTVNRKIKTPISYYGGKQSIVGHILPLIPKHKLYTEAFIGGAAIFFAKQPSEMECINDLNGHVVTFYRVLKNDFGILRKLIIETPSSRKIHRESEFVLKNSEHFNDVKIAWAFWVQTNMSFSANMFAGYGYGKSDTTVKKIFNKKVAFTKHLKNRLDFVDVECNDAIKVIQSRDTVDTFHYVDPPYHNANMGHYSGYTIENFKLLLCILEKVQGKFLLSSYDSPELQEFVFRNGWHQKFIRKPIVACLGDRSKIKTEVLTSNYLI